MSREVLHDARGVRIGEVETTSNKLILRDRRGVRLGEYDMRDNKTRDHRNIPIGTGNLLLTLLR